jgi:hypothetical protein
MGKRELLLIVVFALFGIAVWQLTAPPTDPNEPGFSLQRLVSNLRTELAGQRVEVSLEREAAAVPSPAVQRLILTGYRGALSVVGEDRADVTATLKGTVFGSDTPETTALAEKVTLALKEDGQEVTLLLDRPEMRRRPRLQLDIRLPKRLAVRLEVQGERVEVGGIAAVDATLRFAATQIRDVPGEVKVEQRDGRLEIAGVGAVTLLTRRAEVRVDRVTGPARIEATDDRVTLRRASGPVVFETRRVEVEAEDLQDELKATVTDGTFSARSVAGVVAVESQRCRVGLAVDGRAPVTITAADALVEVTLAAQARVTLDLDQLDGEIRLPADSPITVAREEGHQSAKGALRGGGPLVKVRARQGGIAIR